MKSRIINNVFSGIYTDDFLVKNHEVVKNWELIDLLPTNEQLSYIKLIWTGSEWVESATSSDISEKKTPFYQEKLQYTVSDLRIRAKGLAIGKTGTNSYILAQVDFYQRKYENAISLNPVHEIDTDLESEGLRDFGLSLSDFKSLIISMYNAGKEKENLLMSFIEQGRSAILTLIDLENWENVDLAFQYIESLKGITTVDQARIIKNKILEL